MVVQVTYLGLQETQGILRDLLAAQGHDWAKLRQRALKKNLTPHRSAPLPSLRLCPGVQLQANSKTGKNCKHGSGKTFHCIQAFCQQQPSCLLPQVWPPSNQREMWENPALHGLPTKRPGWSLGMLLPQVRLLLSNQAPLCRYMPRLPVAEGSFGPRRTMTVAGVHTQVFDAARRAPDPLTSATKIPVWAKGSDMTAEQRLWVEQLGWDPPSALPLHVRPLITAAAKQQMLAEHLESISSLEQGWEQRLRSGVPLFKPMPPAGFAKPETSVGLPHPERALLVQLNTPGKQLPLRLQSQDLLRAYVLADRTVEPGSLPPADPRPTRAQQWEHLLLLTHAIEHWLCMGGLTSMAALEAWHTAAIDRDTLLKSVRSKLAKLVRRWPQSMPPGWVQALQLQQSMYSSSRVERDHTETTEPGAQPPTDPYRNMAAGQIWQLPPGTRPPLTLGDVTSLFAALAWQQTIEPEVGPEGRLWPSELRLPRQQLLELKMLLGIGSGDKLSGANMMREQEMALMGAASRLTPCPPEERR